MVGRKVSGKKYVHEKWQVKLPWIVCVLGCIAVGISATMWNAAHINIKNLCENQFTYPKNIVACNAWSHQDNMFGVLTACYGIPCFLGFLVIGMIMLFSYLDKRL